MRSGERLCDQKAVFFAVLVVANLIGVDRTLVYALLGIGLWLAFLLSGCSSLRRVTAVAISSTGEFFQQSPHF